MLSSFLFLVVICLATVFTTTQDSSSVPPYSNQPLYATIGEARYRISTAKLTVDTATRKTVKEYAKTEGVPLEVGRPDYAQVREVQLALAGLVHAESKWDRMDASPSDRITWDKVHGLVQQLTEVLTRWPGVLVDQFALDAIQEFNKAIDPVRPDLKQLQETTDELISKWPNQDLLKRLAEYRKEMNPIRSAVKEFNTALVKYMLKIKELWNTDRIPDTTRQSPVTQALRGVRIRVAYYQIPSLPTFADKVLEFLYIFANCIMGVFAAVGIFVCFGVVYLKITDANWPNP